LIKEDDFGGLSHSLEPLSSLDALDNQLTILNGPKIKHGIITLDGKTLMMTNTVSSSESRPFEVEVVR
jgi:hypothetical protein